jgi:hypothetical protein
MRLAELHGAMNVIGSRIPGSHPDAEVLMMLSKQ